MKTDWSLPAIGEPKAKAGILERMADRIPLYYTFGNHQHWVDMQWLWGYHVLPNSIRDMLKLCSDAGVKGCVNFDGIGYEKLAGEDPEAFADLREAVQQGTFEIVGGSYGQPYGLFHGGESNVRQRIYGTRAAKRLFGVPIRTFWEEEFDFFPQLPQILRGVGIEYASLFFQWTWHTPEVPKEDVPVVWWEGQDGSRLLCATRNALNLHQWPEDMDIVLASLAESTGSEGPTSLVLQWLELMPSPDWMCRSELILPKLRQLMSDPRFDVRPVTLGEYLSSITGGMTVPVMVSSTVSVEKEGQHPESRQRQGAHLPIRKYTMDDVWHGMTLGKNGDNMRRLSRQAEASLLGAETVAAVAGLFGRPYAQWDVYPTWELEEAWRELLSAQHHDNDECEGLCGYVGRFSYERSIQLSGHIFERTARQLLRRIEPEPEALLFNPLGWEREGIPPFGYGPDRRSRDRFKVEGNRARIERGGFRASFDGDTGILEVGAPPARLDLTAVDATVSGELLSFADAARSFSEGDNGELWFELKAASGHSLRWTIDVAPGADAIDLELAQFPAIRPDPGLNPSLKWHIPFAGDFEIWADSPYGVHPVSGVNKNLKKYPTGDWMTSKQWFETVENAFTSSSLVDLQGAASRLLILHDGSQQWFRDADGVSCVLSAKDPWDEDYYAPDEIVASFRICPHAGLPASKCWKMGQELSRPLVRVSEASIGQSFMLGAVPPPRTLPATFAPVACSVPNVALTAFYRETRDSAKGQDFHAADVLGIDYPYIVRMVELDGLETEATLTFEATVARAVKTNLLGEPTPSTPRVPGEDLLPGARREENEEGGSQIHVHLRPFEIATLYVDLVEGRKQVRDLDARREVWATVHRHEG